MKRPHKIRCKYCFPAILCNECKKYNEGRQDMIDFLASENGLIGLVYKEILLKANTMSSAEIISLVIGKVIYKRLGGN